MNFEGHVTSPFSVVSSWFELDVRVSSSASLLVGFFTSVESFPLVTTHVLLVSTCFFRLHPSVLACPTLVDLPVLLGFPIHPHDLGHFLSICANMFTMLVFTCFYYIPIFAQMDKNQC